jgi:hypothetical protein
MHVEAISGVIMLPSILSYLHFMASFGRWQSSFSPCLKRAGSTQLWGLLISLFLAQPQLIISCICIIVFAFGLSHTQFKSIVEGIVKNHINIVFSELK